MKKSYYVFAACAIVAILVPLVFNNAFLVQMMFTAAFFAYVSSSWNIVGGYAGQLGIGNGLFVGMGLYLTTAFFGTLGISPWLGMILAGLITGGISLILGAATFPLSGSYYGLATVALLNILRIVFNENESMFGLFFGGAAGMRVRWLGNFIDMQFVEKTTYYYIVLSLLFLVMLLSFYISKSKWGYYLMAISTNQRAASSLGVNVLAYKLKAQFVSAFLMAIGGGIYGMYMMYMDPQTIFSFQLSFSIMLMAVFGGRGTVLGPVIGAVILMPLSEFLRLNFSNTLPGLPNALFGLMLMLCMQFMPKGLIDKVTQISLRHKLKSQKVQV